jgi:glucokinase
VVLEASERMASDRRARTSLRDEGDSAADLTARTVVAHARAGDALSLAAVEAVGRHLGEGLASLVNLLDPSSVVLGGGLTAAADLLLPAARSMLEHNVLGGPSRRAPRLRVAHLGAAAGIVGAAALARSEGSAYLPPRERSDGRWSGRAG